MPNLGLLLAFVMGYAPIVVTEEPVAGQDAPTPSNVRSTRRTNEPLRTLNRCQSYCAKEHFTNVPDTWLTDFRRVMSNLTPLLGFFDIDIIAWPSSQSPPAIHGRTVQRGQYISGGQDLDGNERIHMVLEIVLNEVNHNHPHRLSVIAHEYFHVYQRYSNPGLNHQFSIKWLIEGSAAVFESMYLSDFEQTPDYFRTAQLRHARLEDFGPRMEHYNNAETNYGTSTAMVLYACREGGFQLLIDFWKRQPNDLNWKMIFAEIFGLTIDEFYAAGQASSFDQLSLSAMGKLDQIQF